MVRPQVVLPAVVGFMLVGSFLLVPATNPPDEYAVSVERSDHVSNPTQYEALAAGYRQVFDAARENGGTELYRGHAYPDAVEFPASEGLSSMEVAYENATYLVQFTHSIEGPSVTGIARMLGSLVAGTALLGYAGYRRYAA